uniref:L-rhamnose-binding lectin CSL2-like n=1 Tax=Pundamilia nyererei TaxID=303518 RepID=A0A3B4G1K2_9CICH
ETAVTCDDGINVQHLSCDNGAIIVQAALYGRKDRETCSEGRPQNQLQNTQCSQNGTVDILKRRCDGRKVCEINTNVVRTSDPCVNIFKYLETNYTCFPAMTCEGSLAHLYCDVGQVILVYGAYYGRLDKTTCSFRRPDSQIQNVYCSNPTPKVAERCNGKNSCTIRASNSVFGDPCVGTYKYLEVSYVCDCKYLFSSVNANSQSSHKEFVCQGVEKCKIHTEYGNNLTIPLFSTLLQILSPSLHKRL